MVIVYLVFMHRGWCGVSATSASETAFIVLAMVVGFFAMETVWVSYYFLIHPEYPWFLFYTRDLTPDQMQVTFGNLFCSPEEHAAGNC